MTLQLAGLITKISGRQYFLSSIFYFVMSYRLGRFLLFKGKSRPPSQTPEEKFLWPVNPHLEDALVFFNLLSDLLHPAKATIRNVPE